MPERTTVVLPPGLKQRAIAEARQQGISFGELVRRALAAALAPTEDRTQRPKGDPFWDNLRISHDGPRDAALRHDQYLYGKQE